MYYCATVIATLPDEQRTSAILFLTKLVIILTMETKQKMMPVKDYAEMKGVSPNVIYNWIKRGKVKGKKIGNYQLIIVE